MTRAAVVEKISEILNEVAPDALKMLFGSEARGDARPDSDFDVLVVLPEKVGRAFETRKSQIFDMLYELELDSGMTIAPLVVPHDVWYARKTPFTINVIREGHSL